VHVEKSDEHGVISQRISSILEDVIGGADQERPIPLHEPYLGREEQIHLEECLESGWVSSAGPFIETFEQDIGVFTGAPNVVATVNGTAALHLALVVAGAGEGDEVLVPSMTFVATVNAITYCGAVPHFIDSEPEHLGVDVAQLGVYLTDLLKPGPNGPENCRTGRRVAAIVVVHTLGHPVDLDGMSKLCEQFDLPLIEDAAEALGSTYHGAHVGTHGLIGTLSFNGNKIVTTGGGGALLIRDEDLAARARHLATTAKQPHAWEYFHDEVAFNYRMPSLNAALGVAQFARLTKLVDAKRKLAQAYAEAFSKEDGIRFIKEPPNTSSNYWLNAIVLDTSDAGSIDQILGDLVDGGYLVRPLWRPSHQLPMFAQSPRMDLPVCEDLARRVISLPSSPGLAMDVVKAAKH
tara:strand:+ start:12741 stop:13961 length:1221 start_codon:yes stop_codon:yes gene_type:complete